MLDASDGKSNASLSRKTTPSKQVVSSFLVDKSLSARSTSTGSAQKMPPPPPRAAIFESPPTDQDLSQQLPSAVAAAVSTNSLSFSWNGALGCSVDTARFMAPPRASSSSQVIERQQQQQQQQRTARSRSLGNEFDTISEEESYASDSCDRDVTFDFEQ
jgi:hypothetical protein